MSAMGLTDWRLERAMLREKAACKGWQAAETRLDADMVGVLMGPR